MSYITDCVLVVAHEWNVPASTRHALLNDVPSARGNFAEMDTDAAGGTKVMCSAMFAAAFNHLDLEDLIRWLAGLDWDGEVPTLLVHVEQEDGFTAYRIEDTEPRVVAGEVVPLAIRP